MSGVTHHGRAGIVDIKGNFVVPAKFDGIQPKKNPETVCVAGLNGKFGLVSSGGATVLPFDHDDIWNPWGNSSFYRITKDESPSSTEKLESIVDMKGAEVMKPVYERIDLGFSEGLMGFIRDGKYGFVDESFRVAIEPLSKNRSDLIWGFHCGRARFQTIEDDKYGYIDTTGQEIVSPIYDDADYQFKHELASVAVGESYLARLHGIIDTDRGIGSAVFAHAGWMPNGDKIGHAVLMGLFAFLLNKAFSADAQWWREFPCWSAALSQLRVFCHLRRTY